MTDTKKKKVIELVETIVEDKQERGNLYLKILEWVESVGAKNATTGDWLDAAKPSLTIHRKPFEECGACSA